MGTMVELASEIMVGAVLGRMTNHDPFPSSLLQEVQGDPAGASPQALLDLNKFTHAHFAFFMPGNFFIQNAAAGSWLALIIVVGFIVLAKRFYEKTFWLFKFQRRSEGVYIVPNALNTFLLLEGCFVIVWIAFISLQYLTYDRHQDYLQHHLGVFNLIIWWPLWVGAFFAGWGSFYTAPGALDKGPLSSSRLGRFVPRPLLVNIFCLGTPILLIVSLIPSIVLTQNNLSRAIDIYDVFQSDLLAATAAASPLVPRSQADAFLQRASDIWQMQATTHYYMSVGYSIWPVWAALFLLFYIPAGGYLAWLVFHQVRRQRSLLEELDRKQRETVKKETPAMMMEDPSTFALVNAPSPGRVPLLFQPLSSSQEMAEETLTVVGDGEWPTQQRQQQQQQLIQNQARGDQRRHVAPSSDEEQMSPPPPVGSPPVTPSTAVSSSDHSEGQEVFFPALKPDVAKRATRKVTQRNGTPASRYRYLRRCFVNLTVLYVSIVLAAAVYLAVAASLARYLYSTAIQGPQAITNLVYGICLTTAWCNVVFGTATFFAIFSRYLDPANASARDDDSSPKGQNGALKRSPFAFRAGTGGTKTLDGTSPHDKTRTLPAVPESVGQTMDSALQSISISRSAWDQQQHLSPDGKPRAKTMMSFRIMRDAGRSGALLLRPTADQLTSQASFGQAESANVSTHGRTSVDESGTNTGTNTPRLVIGSGKSKKSSSSRNQRHRGPGDETSFIMEEYTSQTSSARSYRDGRTVYYPTPYGLMPAPAPPEPKPLPPERSPPRTPIRAERHQGSTSTGASSSRASEESRATGQQLRKSQSLEGRKSLSKRRASETGDIPNGAVAIPMPKKKGHSSSSHSGSPPSPAARPAGMPRTPSLSSINVSPYLSTPPRDKRSPWVARELANQPGATSSSSPSSSATYWSNLPYQAPPTETPEPDTSAATFVTGLDSSPVMPAYSRATSTPQLRSSVSSQSEQQQRTPSSSHTAFYTPSKALQSPSAAAGAATMAFPRSGSEQGLTSPLMGTRSLHPRHSSSTIGSPTTAVKMNPRYSKRESLGEPAPPPTNPIPAAPQTVTTTTTMSPSTSWSPSAVGDGAGERGLGLASLRRGSASQLPARISPQNPTVPLVALESPPQRRRRAMAGAKMAYTTASSPPRQANFQPLPTFSALHDAPPPHSSTDVSSSVLLEGITLGGWKREDDTVETRPSVSPMKNRTLAQGPGVSSPQSPPSRISPGTFF